MNLKQRESMAKYAYDLSKIVITTLALSQILDLGKLKLLIFVVGIIIGAGLIILGLKLEGGEKE